MKTVVIVPAYEEQKYIQRVIAKLQKITPDFVVVDDGSRDKTAQLAQEKAEHVLVHRVNLGKGAALKTGCEYAFKHLNADAVVFMDSDDQHDPQEIKLFTKELEAGAGLVLGVRSFSKDMPLYKQWGNRFASYVVKFMFGSMVPDIPSGYKAMTKRVYEKIKWNARDYGVELEIAVRVAKQKVPFTVVPISTIYLEHDRGMTLIDVAKMLLYILAWRIVL